MPLIARRGSISSRSFGQLSQIAAVPTTITWGSFYRFDNNNDISLFTATKRASLSVSPFTLLQNYWKSATTTDLVTWTEYTTIPIQPSAFNIINEQSPVWGTGKYHVPDASFRPWIQTYYDVATDTIIQNYSTDGLATWTNVPTTNLRSFFNIFSPLARNYSAILATGDTWWRNMGSYGGQANAGQTGPRIVVTTDAGATYTLKHEYEGQTAPFPNQFDGQYGNVLPVMRWYIQPTFASGTDFYRTAPAAIFDALTLTGNYMYFCGSGGTLLSNDPATSVNEFTKNAALHTLVGRYVNLYKVAVSDDRQKMCVCGYGMLPTTQSFVNFAAASSDGGATWSLSTNFGTVFPTIGGVTGALPFGTSTVKTLMYDGTKFIATQGTASTSMASSTDGLIWTVNTNFATAIAAGTVFCVAYNGTRWVAGLNAGRIATSTDFSTWTVTTINSTDSNNCACVWTGTRFVITPLVISGSSEGSYVSTDGITWTTGGSGGTRWDINANSGGLGNNVYLTYDRSNGDLFAIPQGVVTSTVLYSSDGINWTAISDIRTKIQSSGHMQYACGVQTFGVGPTLRRVVSIGDWGYTLLAESTVATGSTFANSSEWNCYGANRTFNTPQKVGPMRAPDYRPVMTNLINPSLTITNGGSGFTNAFTINVRFSAPDDIQNGWEPAISSITVSGGVITGIVLADSGAGYLTPPTVTITGAGAGTGATATCSFKTSTANPAVTLQRLWYWDIPYSNGPNSDFLADTNSGWYSHGAGWYGISALTNPSAAGFVLIPGAGDVTDAVSSNSTGVTLYAGGADATMTNFNADTDNEQSLRFCGSSFDQTGRMTDQQTSSRNRIYWTRNIANTYYDEGSYWFWTKPMTGYLPGTTVTMWPASVYVAGKNIKILNQEFLYHNLTDLGSPGVLCWALGYTLQTEAVSTATSVGTRTASIKPYVRPFVFTGAPGPGGSWTPYSDSVLPAGAWDSTPNTSFLTGTIQQSSPISIVTDAVSATQRGTMTIAYAGSWTARTGGGPVQVTPFAFSTTNGGVTWTSMSSFITYLSGQSLTLLNIAWNQNEGLWVITAQTQGSPSLPRVIVTTPDFVTFNRYNNVTLIS